MHIRRPNGRRMYTVTKKSTSCRTSPRLRPPSHDVYMGGAPEHWPRESERTPTPRGAEGVRRTPISHNRVHRAGSPQGKREMCTDRRPRCEGVREDTDFLWRQGDGAWHPQQIGVLRTPAPTQDTSVHIRRPAGRRMYTVTKKSTSCRTSPRLTPPSHDVYMGGAPEHWPRESERTPTPRGGGACPQDTDLS